MPPHVEQVRGVGRNAKLIGIHGADSGGMVIRNVLTYVGQVGNVQRTLKR